MNRFLILVAVTVALASARIINVPGEYATIQQGIDAAVASDIVLVAPGTYAEEIDLKAGVVVRGSGWERTTIDGGGNSGDAVDAVGNSIGPDTKLEGFTITGAVNGGGMPGGGGVFCNSGARPDIGNCRITGNDAGVALWNGSAAYVHNCIIDHNTYDAVSTGAFATIVNNTIHANRIGFYDNSGYGPVFMNNIVTGNSLYGIYGPSGGTQPTLSYNDVWGNATDYHQAVPGVGCDSADPLYADTAAADYRLLAGSPCIDAGNPASQYNDPDGTRNDMGAFGGPAATTVTSPQLLFVSPTPNAHDVAVGSMLLAGFNMDMARNTFTNRSVRMRGLCSGAGAGTVSYDSASRQVMLTPLEQLLPGEPVMAGLSRGIASLGGDSFAGFGWQFRAVVQAGSGVFSDTAAGAAGGDPVRIHTADFNEDRVLDLAVVCCDSNRIAVRLGNGDGTFQPAGYIRTGTAPRALACADFNDDDIVDMACVSNGAESLDIFFGNGDGTFDAGPRHSCPGSPNDLVWADFNLDGAFDLAALCVVSATVRLFAGDGAGNFSPVAGFAIPGAPYSFAVCDHNRDGRPDLVTANTFPPGMELLAGNGDFTFDSTGWYAADDGPDWVNTGDFDEDGLIDFAVACRYAGTVKTYTGDGAGGVSGSHTAVTAGNPEQVAVSDFNADGHLDLAVTCQNAESVRILLGRGDNAFEQTSAVGVADAWPVTGGDFDGDGDIDLIAVSHVADELRLLRNRRELRVIGTSPEPFALAVPETANVVAQFNQPLDPQTVDSASFRVFGSFSGCRQGVLAYDSAAFTATFNPGSVGAPGERFGAVLTRDMAAAIGVRLSGFGWEWLTRPARSSSGGFGTAADYATGTEPRGSACADFDGDGDIDILTTSNAPAAAALLKNDGAGSFGAAAYTSLAGDPISVYAADMDADGDVDACVLHNEPGASHLEVLRNDGAGHLSVAATYVPATLGQYVSGGDIDNDGDIDVVVTDGWGSQDNVKVMTNNGTGGLSGPVGYSSGSWARGVAVTDVDNDGDADLCVANQGNANVTVLYNDGTGAFPRGSDFAACTNPDGICTEDFNADGRVDLAVASLGGNSVAVLANNGNGGLEPPATWPAGFATRAISANDFDGDGDIDLACVGNGTDNLAVLPGNGDGTFGVAVPYSTGANPWSVTIADYNRDGALDIANVNYGTNNVSVRFATGVGIAAEPDERRATLRLLPNPFSSLLSISLSAVPSAVRVYSAAGRMIRSLPPARSLVWDGCDSEGRQLPDGVYLVCVTAGELHVTRKVVLAR